MYQCSLPCFSHSFQKWSGVKQNSTLISAEWPWWNLFIFWCFLVFKAEILAWLHCGGLEGYRSSTCMLTFESSRTSFISAWGKCGLGGYFLIKLSEPSHSWYIYPSKISDSCFFLEFWSYITGSGLLTYHSMFVFWSRLQISRTSNNPPHITKYFKSPHDKHWCTLACVVSKPSLSNQMDLEMYPSFSPPVAHTLWYHHSAFTSLNNSRSSHFTKTEARWKDRIFPACNMCCDPQKMNWT